MPKLDAMCFSKDGGKVLLYQAPKILKVADLGTGTLSNWQQPVGARLADAEVDQGCSRFLRTHGGRVGYVWGRCYHPSGTFVVKNADKLLCVSDPQDGTKQRVFGIERGAVGYFWSLVYGPRGKRIARTANRDVQIYDGESFAYLGTLPKVHEKEVLTVDFSPDGTRIATGASDNVLRIFDAKTFALLLELTDYNSFVGGVQFSPDGTRLAVCGGNGMVQILDTLLRRERWRQAQASTTARTKTRDIWQKLAR